MISQIYCVLMLAMVSVVLCAPGQGGSSRQMLRLVRDNKPNQRDFTGGDVIRNLMATHTLDKIGGGNLLRALDPYTGGQIMRSLDRGHLLNTLDGFQGGEVLRMLDAVNGGELLSSLDSAEGVAVLNALQKTHTKHPKRMLDSVSGWAFGESKRNFDEIDNVGFTGFAKRWPSPYYSQYPNGNRGSSLSLAKKNFDEIDRAGFETYNKRNFDEIDRTGFETFEKRNAKE